MFGPSVVLPRVLPFTQFYPGFTQLPRVKLGKTIQRFYPPTLAITRHGVAAEAGRGGYLIETVKVVYFRPAGSNFDYRLITG